MKNKTIARSLSTAVAALALFAMTDAANAALLGRDLDGNAATFEAFYDSALDISWLADANLAKTQDFGVAGIGAQGGPGTMTRDTADAWIVAMNAQSYLGVSAWRLPDTEALDSGGAHWHTSGSPGELANLYYTTLGNPPNFATSAGPFSNLEVADPFSDLGYWTSPDIDTTERFGDWPMAWFFQFKGGYEQWIAADSTYRAWAVTDGDVADLAPVPLPAAVWLFGSGLAGLMGMARRRRAIVAG